MLASELLERFVELIRRQPIGLRRNQQEFAIVLLKPSDQLTITLLWWNVGINKTHTQTQRLAICKIGLNELWPFGANLAGNLGVSVAGKISEDQVWLGGLRFLANLNEIDGLRASRTGTDVRDLLAEQGIDQT